MNLEKNIKDNLIDFNRGSYVKEEDEEQKNYLDCSLGVNPFGPPKQIKKILRTKKFQEIDPSQYPQPYHETLKKEISKYWKKRTNKNLYEQIRIGSGSMGILEKINKFLINEQTKVLGITPQFSEYITEIKVLSGQYNSLKLKPKNQFKFPTKKFAKKIEKTKPNIVYIDNPNNPTGQLIKLKNLKKILEKTEETNSIVVVDEAYMDFVGNDNSAINLITDYKNLIVIRSFSKGSGMAGLRVGYGILSKELTKYYDKVNLPFQISKTSSYIVRKILENHHDQYLSKVRTKITEEKQKLIKELQKNYQISKTHPKTPILLIGTKNKDKDLAKTLKEKGILTESGKDFENLTQNYVRIRIPKKSKTLLKKLNK